MKQIRTISVLIMALSFVSSTVLAQDWRNKPPTMDDQEMSPICTWFFDELPEFQECMSKSQQECWDKCEANNYQDGHCAFRDPDREPDERGVILTPWGYRLPSYHNVRIDEERCRNPGINNTGKSYVYANYCRKKGIWRNVNFNGYGYPGLLVACRRNTLTFEIMEEGGATVELEEVHTDGCNDSSFCVRGRRAVTHTFTFNTPFIYFDDVADGDYTVSIDSEFDEYISIPEFNAGNGWNVEVADGALNVDGVQTPDLFYELDLSEVSLSRNGQNFEGRAAMLEYLENSDFYSQLGMKDVEAQNSLDYIQANLEDAPYYYLTVMDDKSIAEVSDLEITGPDGVVETGRRYFAIYPSQVEITTTGSLEFPAKLNTPIKEYGEILVQPTMQIFWK